MMPSVRVNTSNKGKLAEYVEYFSPTTVVSQAIDVKEPDSDPTTIIRFKASQFELDEFKQGPLVEDVALDVEDADIGTKIRWHLKDLPDYVGRKATYVCRLAIRVNDMVELYVGSVQGQLVEPRGDCFGFGTFFLPDGTNETLGENMAPKYNARYLAIERFKTGNPDERLPILEVWKGKFQEEK